MKIIKEGTPKTHTFECKHCGCIFEITDKEYFENASTTYEETGVYAVEFNAYCPSCHAPSNYLAKQN